MRAAVYRENGPSGVIGVEELATPEPGPGQVRVKVACSGVNPTDWKSRSGATAGPPQGPQVPHHDGAGVVDKVGPGVERLRPGQRVWTYMAAAGNRYGTAADYTLVPQERAVALPDQASFELGASLGVPALTAAHCLGDQPRDLAGTRVLVTGGAGAVGNFAIQLAKHAGADVAATVSTAEKAQLARAAGADVVVNYRDGDAAQQLRAWAPQADRIVEVALGANLDLDLELSGPGTVIMVYASEATDPVLPTRRLMGANVALRFMLLYRVPASQLQACVDWVSKALADGALKPLPVTRFSLEETAAAQEAVEKGALGKVLVCP